MREACVDKQQLFLCRDLIKVIGPPLHHFPAFRQVLCVIVGCPDAVPFAVSELTLDDICPETVLVQDSAGRAAKSVPRSSGMVAHAIQGIKHSVLAHERRGIVLVREKIGTVAGVLSAVAGERRLLASTRGTICSSFIFMRSAGIRQSALSQSISVHCAPRSSWVRTKVSSSIGGPA